MGKFYRRVGAIAATFALGWAALGVATPAAAAASCETYFKSYNTVKVGTKGTQTKAAQCLIRRSKRPVRADGSFSAADAAQLRQFQRSVGLARTGVVNDPTWIALIAYGSRPTLSVGDRSVHVTRLQRALRAAGYKTLTGTGFYGSQTVTAVKAVQRGNGIRATGIVGPKFWRLLQSGKLKPGRKAPAPKPAVASANASTKAAKALAFAKRQLGDSYGYGATGPNRWDCSGLTQGAYRSAGVKLPHSARGQMKYGKAIAKKSLKPGDLVFFYSPVRHVAIYAGNGKVIHASRPGKPVGYIKMAYMPYAGARRIG
jgi:cell wall-associated NlpC family hydrolase